jgi:hypothetical protein
MNGKRSGHYHLCAEHDHASGSVQCLSHSSGALQSSIRAPLLGREKRLRQLRAGPHAANVEPRNQHEKQSGLSPWCR